MSTLRIYNEHFGLTERPFTLLPDPDFLYWSDSHSRAYTMLEYGMLTHAPITVITGEIGAGKTTLLRHLLRTLPEEFTVGLISNAQGNRGELLHWVLMALGVQTDGSATYVQLFAQFQDFLIEEYAAGRRTMLIFDEAQNLSVETLEELRMFSNINADKDELIQLVLVGQPELRDLIAQPRLVQFAQRVAAEYHLPAMPADSVSAYINHRLKIAGATREIFTPAACECVHLASKGVPRLINQICDYGLVYAFTDGLDTVDAGVIEQVVTDRRRHGNLKMVAG
ncbi:type II secretory pathway predicted ATPase ExeA [Amaricoccus macauensis]|uniref:Type II secretory pathway predicted ATPase ExeA n=1 Tax=Amaricoccus macauensis TaxID=57001 RepID=A0A840SZ91_9RHOB|nr:AAA family ATPase [Amaricoccus macauensis]MBB5224411.1 type II secretory pathway predicted ATPase ExeA [Amaricoccus macauensis]